MTRGDPQTEQDSELERSRPKGQSQMQPAGSDEFPVNVRYVPTVMTPQVMTPHRGAASGIDLLKPGGTIAPGHGDGRRSAEEPLLQPAGDGMCPIPGAQLDEQPTGVGFHRALGQRQLPPDLTVRAAHAHSQQDLPLTVGQRDTDDTGRPGNAP